MSASFKVTSDFTKQFNETIARFKKDAVLVGIPEDDNGRDETERGQASDFGNAAILALNHFGSEEAHIPPSPVLSRGIKNAQDELSQEFKKAAQGALSAGASALEVHYERAGTIAANACKKVINDQDGLKAPAEATLKARKYLTQSGFKGEKRLLVTGQVRNAITYVVRSIRGK